MLYIALIVNLITIHYFILRCIALIVNLITIHVIRVNRKLRSPLNLLIASLCVADALVFIYVTTRHIYTITVRLGEQNIYISIDGKQYRFKVYTATWTTVACYVAIFSNQLSSLRNIVHLHVMGLERLLAIAKPMYWRAKMTISLSKKIIAFIWFVMVLKLSLEIAFGRNEGNLLTCAVENFFQ